jgi:hypothetical protein
MYYLQTHLDPRDAFVVAVQSAYRHASVPLETLTQGQTVDDRSLVRLEMQVDNVSVLASLPPPPGADARAEFLEESPDMLEVALRDFLKRQQRRESGGPQSARPDRK